MAGFSHQVLHVVTRSSRGSCLLSKRHSCSSLSSKAYLHVDPPRHVSPLLPLRHSGYAYPHCYRGHTIGRGHNSALLNCSIHISNVWFQDAKEENTKASTEATPDTSLAAQEVSVAAESHSQLTPASAATSTAASAAAVPPMPLSKVFAAGRRPDCPVKIKVLLSKQTPKLLQWSIMDGNVIPSKIFQNTVAAITVCKLFMNGEFGSQIVDGKTYIIRNYSINKFGQDKSLIFKHDTALYDAAPLHTSEALMERAQAIFPPATPMLIKDIVPDMSTLVTVEGFVSANDTTIKVVLWREATLAQVMAGTLVKISHLRARRGWPGVSLHTTLHSHVQVATGETELTVVGVRHLEGGNVELLDTERNVFFVEEKVWGQAYPEGLDPIPESLQIKIAQLDGKIVNILVS